MKVIICDKCGKSVPDGKTTDIMPISVSYGWPEIAKLERDICGECLNNLLLFFEPVTQPTARPVVKTMPDFGKPEVKEITDLIKSTIQETEDTMSQAPATINCGVCGKPFVPKSKRSRLCSHQCENKEWLEKQKAKKLDEQLAKLKKENPIHEVPRPALHREFI